MLADIGERALADDQLTALLELMRHWPSPRGAVLDHPQSRNAARAAGITARPVSAASSRARIVARRCLFSAPCVRGRWSAIIWHHVTVLGDLQRGRRDYCRR